MIYHQSLHRLLMVSLLIPTAGCAAAYHDYPCGPVPYEYCAPQPLPYTGYDSCPTPIARCYLSQGPVPIEPILSDDVAPGTHSAAWNAHHDRAQAER